MLKHNTRQTTLNVKQRSSSKTKNNNKMKHLTLLSLLLAAVISCASAQSMLKVRRADNERLNVAVDGRYFNKTGTSVTVGDLPPGRHRFTIYAAQQDRRGRGREEAVYSGKIVTIPGYVTIVTYDPNSGEVTSQDQDIESFRRNMPSAGDGAGAYGRNAPQVNNNGNDYGNDNKYIDQSTPVASPVAAGTLTDSKINDLKAKVGEKKTDTEKWNMLKEELKNETETTDQVAAIMDWFNFESTKVDFAKWAYPNTVDKENFPNLENKLSYKNYVDELDKFIKDNNR